MVGSARRIEYSLRLKKRFAGILKVKTEILTVVNQKYAIRVGFTIGILRNRHANFFLLVRNEVEYTSASP